MNNEWQSFLQTSDFPSTPQDTQQRLYDLSNFGVIQANGADVQTFFQGQLTNDVQQISATQAQLNASCNPKGRMLCTMRLVQHHDTLHLLLYRPLLEAMLKRLRMYVLRSDVTLTDVSDQMVLCALEDPKRQSALSLPEQTYAVTQDADLSMIRIENARYLLLTDTTHMVALWRNLAPHAQCLSGDAFRLSEIQAGVPMVLPGTVESFVPQMVNLTSLDGVSFNKGCYTGQEIVARMHYLGKLKKRMYHANVSSEATPQPGDKLYVGGSEQSIGEIVDAQPSTDQQHELLATLQIAQSDKTIHCGSQQGAQLTLLPLPYDVADS